MATAEKKRAAKESRKAAGAHTRGLAADRAEKSHSEEFEEVASLTLGLSQLGNGRLSGSAYHPILERCDRFLGAKLSVALVERRARAAKPLELNEHVNAAVQQLEAKGLESPYLKAFVVARINHLRFVQYENPDFDSTIDKGTRGGQAVRCGQREGRSGRAERGSAVERGVA